MGSPISLYLRLIDYNSRALNSNGTYTTDISPIKNGIDTSNKQFIKILSYNNEIDQVLSIGSQTTGAGAGKVIFNPLKISKSLDSTSPDLFRDTAAGIAFK